jgi:hypothetical protein
MKLKKKQLKKKKKDLNQPNLTCQTLDSDHKTKITS